MRFELMHGGRSVCSILAASRFSFGPNFPDRANAKAVSLRVAMKFTAEKCNTMLMTFDSVITRKNIA